MWEWGGGRKIRHVSQPVQMRFSLDGVVSLRKRKLDFKNQSATGTRHSIFFIPLQRMEENFPDDGSEGSLSLSVLMWERPRRGTDGFVKGCEGTLWLKGYGVHPRGKHGNAHN